MDGFERRREQKKNDILRAALTLFMEYGIQKVSVAEIAKKANVSQVTIYNYFESKDMLIRLVFKFYVDQIWNEQKAILESDLPFWDKMKQFAFEKSEVTNKMSENFFKDFMKDYATGESYVEEVYVNEAVPCLLGLFQEGKEQGYIDKSISNEAILIYLQMFKEYMQRQDVSSKILLMTEDLTKLFYFGLFGKGE